MKKIKIITTVLILICLCSTFFISYAISNDTNSNNKNIFFLVDKEKVAKEDTLELYFNLNSIEKDKFTILLYSNIKADEIYLEDENTDLNIDEENNSINIEVDKEKLKLDKISLFYKVPSSLSIGTKMEFKCKVVEKVKNEMQEDVENVILEESNTLEVTEKIEDNKNQNTDKSTGVKPGENEDNKTSSNSNNEKVQNNKNSINNQTGKNLGSISTKNMESRENSAGKEEKEVAVYNGSNNNYLSKLSIKGIDLNTKFNKENLTYFIKVSNSNKLTVNAVAESSTAKVNIEGEDNISLGENKILISVTAENGNVRYYRIFVNYEEDTDEA